MAKKKKGASQKKGQPQQPQGKAKAESKPASKAGSEDAAVADAVVAVASITLTEQPAAGAPEEASAEDLQSFTSCVAAYGTLVKLCKEYVVEDNDQVFLVDLDTLVLDVLSNSQLDRSCGAQVLHCLFVLEKILQLLKRNRRVFDIVSFDCFEQCVVSPEFKFIRAVCMKHIATQTGIKLLRFKGWWTPEYVQYFNARALAFVMVGDGYLAPAVAEGYDANMALYMKLYTLTLLSNCQRAVRSSEMSFGVTTITAFEMIIVATESRKAVAAMLPAKVPVNLQRPAVDAAALKALMPAAKGPQASRRLVLAYAVAKALQGMGKSGASVSPAEVARLVLVHGLALEQIPVSHRSHQLPSKVEAVDAIRTQALVPFLTAMYPHAEAALHALPSTPLLDIIDGRLLLKLCLTLAANKALASSAKGLGLADPAAADQLWAGIKQQAKCSDALYPILKLTLPGAGLLLEPAQPSFLQGCDLVAVNPPPAAAAAEAPKEEAKAKAKAKEEEEEDALDSWEDLADDDEAGGDDDDGDDDWEKLADDDEEGAEEAKPDPAPQAAATKAAPAAKLAQSEQSILKINSGAIEGLLPAGMEQRLEAVGIVKEKAVPSLKLDTIVSRWDLDIKFEDGINKKEEEEKKEKIFDPKERRRRKRRRQRQMKDMHKYAASLVGGKTIPRDVVVMAEKEGEQTKEKKAWAGKGGGGGKKGKEGKLSQKEMTRLSVEKAKVEKQMSDVDAWARAALNIPSFSKRLEFMSRKLLDLSHPAASIKGHLKLLEWSIQEWRAQANKLDPANYGPAVHVFQLTHDIFRRFHKSLSPADVKFLCENALCMLGFDDAAKDMETAYMSATKNHVTINYKDFQDASDRLPLTSAKFQMEYAGHVMLRDVKSAKDPRVKDFYPDEWQRHLLDVVDANESCLVVAPTSAGKTFISYYAMKQTLLANSKKSRIADKNFIVFVAPEKALVNQVAADVYRTFGPVYGTLLPSYHHRVSDCEVLITVPEMLDVLLLSPVYEKWVARINYVIFDEVHCLGLDNGGIVWERVLSLLNVPFLALSATLGNSQQFFEWLAAISGTYDHKVRLVHHETRWSDLQKYMFLPDREPSVGFLNLRRDQLDGEHIVPIHPYSALPLGAGMALVEETVPPMTLAPKESIELYHTMLEVALRLKMPAPALESLRKLDPDTRFKASYIGKREAGVYEQDLKAELDGWLAQGHRTEVEAMLGSLSSAVERKIKKMESVSKDYPYGTEFLKDNFLPALVELNAKDQLPAVVFCLNRQLCVDLALDVLFRLEAMEEKTHAEEGTLDKRDDKSLKALQKAEKRKRDKKTNSKEAEEEAKAGLDDDSGPPAEDAYKVDPRFSFVKEGEHMNYTDLKYWMDRMIYRTEWDRNHPLVRALFRGIGVHHAGMPSTYKDLVETLFRGKHIKIVVATNTLAMGINMPCRTAMFAGNDKLITPLLFRQMQGRAGRRGYDDVGHVVFFGFEPRTASRLMTSRLETLQGHYPLSNTLVLRFMNLYHFSKDKDNVLKKFRNILLRPYMASGLAPSQQAALTSQLQHHLRFSLEYCARHRVIDPETGAPTGMAQFVMHLHEHAPANFVLAGLISDGTISKICTSSNKSQAAQNLLHLLQHLFLRIPLPAGVTTNPFADDAGCSNDVVLPPINSATQAKLEAHDRGAMELMTHAMRIFARSSLPPSAEAALPASGAAVPAAPVAAAADGSAMAALGKCSQSALARSPLSTLAGQGDALTAATDVLMVARDEIFFNSVEDVPLLEIRDMRGERLALNSYALDFYKNGSKDALLAYNNLMPHNVWFVLKDWSNLLLKILEAINMMMPSEEEEDAVYKTFSFLADKFKERIREMNATTTKTVTGTGAIAGTFVSN